MVTLDFNLPKKQGDIYALGQVFSSIRDLIISEVFSKSTNFVLIITPDTLTAETLYQNLAFFSEYTSR